MSLRQLKFKPKIHVPISKQRAEIIEDRKQISYNFLPVAEHGCHAQVKVEPISITEDIPRQQQIKSNIEPCTVKQKVESVESKVFDCTIQTVVQQSCKDEVEVDTNNKKGMSQIIFQNESSPHFGSKEKLETIAKSSEENGQRVEFSFLSRKSKFKPKVYINSKVLDSIKCTESVDYDKPEDANEKILDNIETSLENRGEVHGLNLPTVPMNSKALPLPISNAEMEGLASLKELTMNESNVKKWKVECNNSTDDSKNEKLVNSYNNSSSQNILLDMDKSEFDATNSNNQSHSSSNENNTFNSLQNENKVASAGSGNKTVQKGNEIDFSKLKKLKPNSIKMNAIFGSKSIRSCHHHLGEPYKPKLTNRTKRPFTFSTFRKMNYDVKEKYFKKFGHKEPNASELTIMESIFCHPASKHGYKEPETYNSDENISNARNQKQDEEVIINKTHNNQYNRYDSNDDDVPVPQLKVSSDGKLVIAPESVVVEHSVKELVSDFGTSEFSMKKKRKKNTDTNYWSHEETMKFYKALNSIGADFAMMQYVFPNRSRNNIKNKFKKEERVHGELVAKVLKKPAEFNIDEVLNEIELDQQYERAVATHGRSLQRPKPKIKKTNLGKLLSGGPSSKLHEDGTPVSKEEMDKLVYVHYLNGKKDPENIEKERKERATEMRRLRKLKKYPGRSCTEFVRIINKLEEEVPKEKRKQKRTSSDISDFSNNEDHIKISTNIEYDTVKYTQSITYNPSNLENPIEINETISHENDSTFFKPG